MGIFNFSPLIYPLLSLSHLVSTFAKTEEVRFRESVVLFNLLRQNVTHFYPCCILADAGVFGRNSDGKYFTIIVGRTDNKHDETTGLAFGRNYKNMYVSYQGEFHGVQETIASR